MTKLSWNSFKNKSEKKWKNRKLRMPRKTKSTNRCQRKKLRRKLEENKPKMNNIILRSRRLHRRIKKWLLKIKNKRKERILNMVIKVQIQIKQFLGVIKESIIYWRRNQSRKRHSFRQLQVLLSLVTRPWNPSKSPAHRRNKLNQSAKKRLHQREFQIIKPNSKK